LAATVTEVVVVNSPDTMHESEGHGERSCLARTGCMRVEPPVGAVQGRVTQLSAPTSSPTATPPPRANRIAQDQATRSRWYPTQARAAKTPSSACAIITSRVQRCQEIQASDLVLVEAGQADRRVDASFGERRSPPAGARCSPPAGARSSAKRENRPDGRPVITWQIRFWNPTGRDVQRAADQSPPT
jgi:hypothetical protein